MATTDTVLIALSARKVWPNREIRSLVMARMLPWVFLAFIFPNLFYQVSVILDRPTNQPVVIQTLSIVAVAAMILLALTSRIAREETLARADLEARIRAQALALGESEAKALAAERLAVVGRLSAGIAHQINSPIGGILAATQFELSNPDRSGLPGSLGKTLETIEREAMRCARIVRNVLLFSRDRPGLFAREDLNAIVESAVVATLGRAQEYDGSVHMNRTPVPLPVRGNGVELEQALVDLITNAIESSSATVRVVVRTARQGANAVCTIVDDGDGIPDSIRDHIFGPFPSTKTRAGGSGLGLSVVHGIISSHGGSIRLVETGSRGTCFRFTIPLDKSNGEKPPAEA